MNYANLFFIFSIGMLIIETIWYFYWFSYKRENFELEIVHAVRGIVQPYNEKRLRRCNAMINYIETKV